MLSTAVAKGKLEDARAVLDAAFWSKQENAVKPDGFLLLVAAANADRPMVQLLVTRGATWTREEAKIARMLVGDEKMDRLHGVLMSAGIDARFSREELKKPDLLTAMRWRHQARHSNVSASLIGVMGDAAAGAQTELAYVFMRDKNTPLTPFIQYRGQERGNGTFDSPLNVDKDFAHILQHRGQDAALDFLTALTTREGLRIKPIVASGYAFWGAPETFQALIRMDALASVQPNRLTMLEEWSVLEEDVTFSNAYTVRRTPEHIQTRHAAFSQTAACLFGKYAPLNAQEAEAFIDLHNRRVNFTPVALERMKSALLACGFFSGEVWTPERLARLTVPSPDSALSRTFNKMAIAKKVRSSITAGPLGNKTYDAMIDAIKADALIPTAAETNAILRHLMAHMKRDTVTQNIQDVLTLLREKKANCDHICPDEFLGKRAPGLAKALLDAGLITADNFDITKPLARIGGKLTMFNLLTSEDDKGYAHTEFVCQLVLERRDPDKYIPLRGTTEPSAYQNFCLKEWAKLSRGSGSFLSPSYPPMPRLIPPPPPPRPLRPRPPSSRIRRR